jgi:hypothetical protein
MTNAAMWECPECCFRFDAGHTNQNGGYSCPVCSESALRAYAVQLRSVLLDARDLLDQYDGYRYLVERINATVAKGSDDGEVRSPVVGGAQDTQAGGDSGGMPLSVGRSRPDQTATSSNALRHGQGPLGSTAAAPCNATAGTPVATPEERAHSEFETWPQGDPYPWIVREPSGQCWGPFATNEAASKWADDNKIDTCDFEDVMPPPNSRHQSCTQPAEEDVVRGTPRDWRGRCDWCNWPLVPEWIGGLAEWDEGRHDLPVDRLHLAARQGGAARCSREACGKRVIAGGPALFLVKMQHELADVAEIGTDYPDAVARHNPLATFASRGCPVGCWFCIVPAMEGREFTLLPDFPVRPVLCDNNLSALPAGLSGPHHPALPGGRRAAARREQGFEPITFTPDVYARWKPLVNAGRRAVALRLRRDEGSARRCARGDAMLAGRAAEAEAGLRADRQRALRRVHGADQEVIDHGCEPHVQPYMKLNALEARALRGMRIRRAIGRGGVHHEDGNDHPCQLLSFRVPRRGEMMARYKNAEWNVPEKPMTWVEVNTAILMDIRDELQQLNRLLACPNFIGIPRTLRAIDRKLAKKRKPKAKTSRPPKNS